jgi:hypothetical protein
MKTIISRITKDKSTWEFPTGYGYTMFLFGVLLALTSSCNKNELLEKNTGNEQIKGFYKSGLDLSGVELLDGILRFEDANIYNSVIDQLDEACDEYWDYILEMMFSEYGELDDDEFNDIIDQLAIHEDQPLLDFEGLFFPEFYSLRKHLELLELEWLEQEDPTEPDPDDHDVFDDAERAVHNSLGEIIIGTDIFKVYPSGTRIVIKNLDFELLEMINGMDTLGLDTLRHPNFEFWYKSGSPKEAEECYDTHSIKKNPINGDRKMKVKFKIDNWPAKGSYLKGKLKNFKKKNNGGWKTFKTNSEIFFVETDYTIPYKGGPVYNDDCDKKYDLPAKHIPGKKKAKRKGKQPLPLDAPNIKSGEHSALFQGSLNLYQLTLEW